MPALLDATHITSTPIQPGDAGIIIRPDLSFSVFSTHKLDATNGLTPEQEAQGEVLLALAVALKFPNVMEILKTMAVDPRIVGEGIDLGALN